MAKLPNGIRQRGDSFLVDVSWQGSRRTATEASLEAAIATRARLDADLKNPSTPALADDGGSAWSLKIAYDRTHAARWAGTKGEKTATIFATAALDYFGRTRSLGTIDADAIDGYVAALVKLGNSDATINRKLSMLSTMLGTAVDRKKLKVKPKMPHRKEYKGRIRFLTPAEEATVLALANQWDKLDEADAIAVFLDTGLRASELTYIEPRDLNHSNTQNSVTVWENKGDEPRTIPLTVRAYSILRRRAITHKTKLFPYDKDWTRSFWDRAKASMGLTEDKQFVIHALRHTFASRLVQRGVPLVAVQQLMGHKDIKTTMRYAHLAPNNFPDAIAVLEPQALRIAAE